MGLFASADNSDVDSGKVLPTKTGEGQAFTDKYSGWNSMSQDDKKLLLEGDYLKGMKGAAYGQGFIDPFTTQKNQGMLDAYAAKYGSRVAPTASSATLGPVSTYGGATAAGTTIDTSQDAATRGYQMDLLSKLKAQAEGTGPSLAGAQLKQGLEQNLLQQQSAAASLRGRGNAGLAMRNLGNVGAQMGATTNAQMANAKIAEQLGALQQYGGASAAARGLDQQLAINQAGLTQGTNLANAGFQQQAGIFNAGSANDFTKTQAGFNQQTNLANLTSQLQTMGLNDQQINSIIGRKLGIDENDRQSMIDFAKYRHGMEIQDQDRQFREQQADRALYGGAASGMAQLLTLGAYKGFGGGGDSGGGAATSGGSPDQSRGYAKGGIVGRGGPEEITVGEEGPEAVVPLSPERSMERASVLDAIGRTGNADMAIMSGRAGGGRMGIRPEVAATYNSGGSVSGNEIGQPEFDEQGNHLAYFKGASIQKKLKHEWLTKQANAKENLIANQPVETTKKGKSPFLEPVYTGGVTDPGFYGQNAGLSGAPTSITYGTPMAKPEISEETVGQPVSVPAYNDYQSIPFKKKPMSELEVKKMLAGIKVK